MSPPRTRKLASARRRRRWARFVGCREQVPRVRALRRAGVSWTWRSALLPAHREQIERAVEVGLACGADREVARGDRRREAAVEGARDAESLVHRVPADPQRELVRAQLARVVDAMQLDPRERA